MGYEELYKSLLKMSPIEQRLKEYYVQNKRFCAIEKILQEIPHQDYSILGFDFIPENKIDLLNNAKTPFELIEEDYFASGSDIRVMKNLQYSKITEHQHSFFEIMYMLSGDCRNTIDEKDNMMQVGDMCIIPPQVPHSIEINTDDGVLINILIRTSTFTETFMPLLHQANILSDYFNEILYSHNYKKYLMFHLGEDEVIRNYVLEMYQEQKEKKAYHTDIMNGLLIVFFGKLLQRHEEKVEYPVSYVEKHNIVPMITGYIRKNCSDVSLKSCAETFHFNPQYLSALLKKHTGNSFNTLLVEARMNAAAELLKKSELSVEQIGISIGYHDPTYFMKVFKKYYGRTPGSYRKFI